MEDADRWRQFASRSQGLAPVGRVVLRARRARKRSVASQHHVPDRVVAHEALADANSWASDRPTSGHLVWAAHSGDAAADALARCADSRGRNNKRALAARAALAAVDRRRSAAGDGVAESKADDGGVVESKADTDADADEAAAAVDDAADEAPAATLLLERAPKWPPPVAESSDAGGDAFAEVPWMLQSAGPCLPAGDAWGRVLREAGEEALAEPGYYNDKVTPRGARLARRLSAWAWTTAELLLDKVGTAGGVALPPALRCVGIKHVVLPSSCVLEHPVEILAR